MERLFGTDAPRTRFYFYRQTSTYTVGFKPTGDGHFGRYTGYATASPNDNALKATSFFDLSAANLPTQEFEYVLNWEGFGKAEVQSIDVYLGFVKAPATGNPSYPIILSKPGEVYPSVTQFPLPSRVGANDKLYQTVTEFPKTFTTTAAQLATFTGSDLSKVVQNDYFLFKFILNLKDGRRIEGFQENVCDEARGEVGDCLVGVRFRKK